MFLGILGNPRVPAKSPWAGSSKPKPAVGCPWAGKEIENPTQTRVWRGLARRVLLAPLLLGRAWNVPTSGSGPLLPDSILKS